MRQSLTRMLAEVFLATLVFASIGDAQLRRPAANKITGSGRYSVSSVQEFPAYCNQPNKSFMCVEMLNKSSQRITFYIDNSARAVLDQSEYAFTTLDRGKHRLQTCSTSKCNTAHIITVTGDEENQIWTAYDDQ